MIAAKLGQRGKENGHEEKQASGIKSWLRFESEVKLDIQESRGV